MSGIVAALLDGKPIPVAVVADQQDLKHEKDAGAEVEVTSGGETLRQRRQKLMDMLDED